MTIEVKARRGDPSTSHAAAAAITADQERLRVSVQLVLTLFRDAPVGLTDFELAPRFLAHRLGSAGLPRMARKWARDQGLVRFSGMKRRNPKGGREAQVWVLGRDDDFLASPLIKCPTCGHMGRAELNDEDTGQVDLPLTPEEIPDA